MQAIRLAAPWLVLANSHDIETQILNGLCEGCDKDGKIFVLSASCKEVRRPAFNVDMAKVPASDPNESVAERGSVGKQATP